MKYLGLIWSALYRKPLRSFLTLASIFVAFLLFGLLQSVSVAFSEGVDFSGVDRLIIAPKYSIIDPLPEKHALAIKAITGVELVSHRSWFGGVYQDTSQFFPRWPVPPESFLAMYPEYVLTDAEKTAFIQTRTGAVIGRPLAEAYNLKLGDKIPLIGDIWPNKDNTVWEFDLVGIYDVANDSVETDQMFINFEFFDEYRQSSQGTVGNIVAKINDPDNSAAIAAEIDRLFANSSDETKTTTEKAYNQMFAKQVGDIGLIMTGILSAVFFTILLLTGNTMAQAIRERIPELAILKTIGFSNGSVLVIVLCEALLIVLVGTVPGLLLAGGLLAEFSQSVSIFNGVELSMVIVAQGIGLALLMALIVGLPPALRAMRVNIVDALGDHQ